MSDIPEDYEENRGGDPNKIDENVRKMAIDGALRQSLDLAKERAYTNLVILTQDENDVSYSSHVGDILSNVELAMIYVDNALHDLIERNELSKDESRTMEKGLGLNIVHKVIHDFNLIDEDINLNNLKQPFEEVFKTMNELEEEVQEDLEKASKL